MPGKSRVWTMAAAILSLALAIAPLSANALTLKQVVEHAVHTSPKVGVASAERRASGYQLKQAKGRLLPKVNLEADVGEQKVNSEFDDLVPGNGLWLDRRQIAVNASQILFDGLDIHYDTLKNAARVDAAALRVLDRSEVVALEAVEAYIDFRRRNEVLAVAQRNVGRHGEILGLVRAQHEGGKVPLSEVNQIESQLEAANATVATSRRQVSDTRAEFIEAVGLEPAGLESVAWPQGVPANAADAITLAAANNSSIRAAIADIDVAAYARNQSRSEFFPQISLEGTARASEDIGGNVGYDNELLGRLVLRWNIFDGHVRLNRTRELTERLNVAKLQTEVRRRSVVETVEKAWSALAHGGEQVTALEAQESSARKVVDSFLQEYELSRRTLLEVLDAESLLFNTRVQLIGARSIRLFAAYQLLASTGTILSSLGIAPPPESNADVQLREHNDHHAPFDVLLDPLTIE